MHLSYLVFTVIVCPFLLVRSVTVPAVHPFPRPKNPHLGKLMCYTPSDGESGKRPAKVPAGPGAHACISTILDEITELDTRRPPQLSTWSASPRDHAYFKVPKFYWSRMSVGTGCATRITMRMASFDGVARQGVWEFSDGIEYIEEHCAADQPGGYGLGGWIPVGRHMAVSWMGMPAGWPPVLDSPFRNGSVNRTEIEYSLPTASE